MDHSKYEFMCPVCQKGLNPHTCHMHEEVQLDSDEFEYVACEDGHRFICRLVENNIEGGGWMCELTTHSHQWPIGTEFMIKPTPIKQEVTE